MGRRGCRRAVGYGALSACLLSVAGCGTQSAALPLTGAPTTTAVAAGAGTAGVTASAAPTVTAAPRMFTATPAPTQAPTGVTVTAIPHATARRTGTSPTAAPAPTGAPPAQVLAPRPPGDLHIVQALIPYSATRKAEMADYSQRHYGSDTWQLDPTMIVLHFTAGSSWQGARNTFAADVPNTGELPGTCSHYVVAKDGTVYQLVPDDVRCRHTIGLNDQAIGIEMVQETGSSSGWADQQILSRPAQVGAALALVRSLQAHYGIPIGNVIGHAMANADPHFHDRLGWHNDHSDWLAADVATFRSRL